MADINQLREFPNKIFIEDFKSFISISKTSSITYLKDNQWERLKWEINQRNKGFFTDVTAPYAEELKQEFEKDVAKEQKKPLHQLEKKARKDKSQPIAYSVQTKTYHRSPAIAAYVKKRANGICQLCGKPAPFNDEYGEPYLECHHIVWLSKGGMDSIDNCVALCPNCHRKMHIINDSDDIDALKRTK